ncbi:MAG: ferredoxin [Acidimicrobiales bacterium]|jgi:ferredoxin
MRVRVDLDLCQGHGVCESEAPGVFLLGKQTTVTILDDSPDEARRAEVEAAVHFCPTSALHITEEE